MKNVQEFTEKGFKGFVTLKSLHRVKCSSVPKSKGVYLILPPLKKPLFLTSSLADKLISKKATVDLNSLSSKWVANAPYLYIGKAGGKKGKATLKDRIRAYVNYGLAKTKSHSGGRYIWQTKGAHRLIICWKPVCNNDPRQIEHDWLVAFKKKYKFLPFANLRT